MCILDTNYSIPSSCGVLFVLDFLGVVVAANAHSSRMISVVEHQATVESGLKMRIKRKNLSPSCLTSVAKVISSADVLFESLENGHTRDPEEAGLPEKSKDSTSDGNLAIAKRNKKCRKNARGNLRSRGSSKSRKSVGHFVHEVEGVTSGDDVTETCCGLVKDFSDTQDCSNMEESTEMENDRPLELGNGNSLPAQSQYLDEFPEKEGLKEINDSEGEESEERDTCRKSMAFVEQQPPSEDASTDGCQRRDAGTEMCDTGVITDPDCLGPCEPGTSVILEGIVWNESNNGILVVNVTWRGKTYVGTLMDTTKHDWAPPRFREDSPQDESSMTSSRRGGCSSVGSAEVIEGRRLRKCRRDAAAAAAAAAASSATKSWCVRLNTDSTETMPRQQPLFPEDSSERSRCSSSFLKRTCRITDGSETWIECSEPNCEKKYRRKSGLRYHQSHAHRRPTTAGGIDAFSWAGGQKAQLGMNPFVELSRSMSPDAGKDSEGLAITSEKPDLDGSDVGDEKTSLLSRKRKAVAESFCKKLRTTEEEVGGHLPSYSGRSEQDLVDTNTKSYSVELNCESPVESNENRSNSATDDATTGLLQNSGGQFSFLDKKMSSLSFNSNPNSPQKNSGSPSGSNSKNLRLCESLPMVSTCSSNGSLTLGETTLSSNDVSCDLARQKVSVIASQQIFGTKTSTSFAVTPKSHPLSDQSSDDKLIPNMEVKSDPLIVCSVSGKSYNSNLSDYTCCNELKPKKVTQVCNSKSLQNTSVRENHSPRHESNGDHKHLRECSELCAIATFDCNVFDKPSECSLSEEIPGAFVEDALQRPSSGLAGCDQRKENLVRKHANSASTVSSNPLCGGDALRVVKERQSSLTSTRNGIRKKPGFDEDHNIPTFSASQLSCDPPQWLPDLIEAFDDLPDTVNAPRSPSADSILCSDDPFKEPRTAEEPEDKECFRRIESIVVSLVDNRPQTLGRKTCYPIQQSSENMTQVSGEESVPTGEKEASTLNTLYVRVNDFVKHSDSRQPLGLDTNQSNSPALLPSQMPSKKTASYEDLSLDEHSDNSKKHHALSILHRPKKSTDGKDHHSTIAEQSKQGRADEPHSRLSVLQSSTKNSDVQDSKPIYETGNSDPELHHRRPQHPSTTPAEQDTVTAMENHGRESHLHSSRAVQDESSFSATGRQKTEAKSINECRTRSWKGGDVHRVQNDLDLSQVKGVTAQNSNRRTQSRNRLSSPSGDRHLHSHVVTKSPFNHNVYGQYATSLLSPSSLLPAVVIPDLYGPK